MSVFTILGRNMKWRFHNAFTIVITILQPLLWLALYSGVAGQTMMQTGFYNYTAFILPGLLVLVSFSVSCSSGIMNYLMKSDRSFYRILISPVNRSTIVLGQLFEAVLCTFLEAGILGIVSLLFSVSFTGGLLPLVFSILLVFLTAFFMAGVSYAISLILPNEVVYETTMNAIVLPVFFLSTALFPADSLTGVMGMLVKLNPFTHVINALRTMILYGRIEWKQTLFAAGLLMVLGSLSFAWAVLRLKKE